MAESNLVTLFKTWAELESPPIIELQDNNHKPIGALYLQHLKYETFAISETTKAMKERYFIYIDGVGIYFSFYKKINCK